MYRIYLKTAGPTLAFLPLNFNFFSSDVPSGHSETEKQLKKEEVKQETGWDRLKAIFESDEFGAVSPELSSIMQVGSMSLFVGALYGGIMASRTTYTDFIRNNQATAFRDHIDAKKKLHDGMILSFGKGSFRWGWRLALFCTSFVGIYTVIQTYRGKYGFIEYISAGTVTGALYKFNMGPRGWLVGGGLGFVLGAIGGGLTNFVLSLTGMTMEETRYWRNYYSQKRSSYFYKSVNESLDEEWGGKTLLKRDKALKDDVDVNLDAIDAKQ